tara:strand:+ start:4206 stop:10139 length:5934 start_codon:yes stop_codon:yes gene_type:complete
MKLTRTFTKGIMNKDLDERLIPPGQYRDGQNIGVSTSEDSNVGSIENMLGNTQVGGDLSYLSSAAKSIGAIANPASEEFYWFVKDTNFDYILRYNEPANSTAIILKDTAGRVLKFDSEYVITGVNIIGDLLFWTDNLNPPRRLNILKYYAANAFTEDDISVIVKPPLSPPSLTLENTTGVSVPSTLINQLNNLGEKYIRFAYRWKYENNEFSSLSPFSATAFAPTEFSVNYSEDVFTSMINGFNQVKINIDTGDVQVTDVQLLFFDEFTGSVYVIETFDKKLNNWLSNSNSDVTFNNNKIYSILSADEVTRLFDNVPRKAQSQEIIGSRLVYGNYTQGYNIHDSLGDDLAIDFNLITASRQGSTFGPGIPSFKSDRDYEAGIVYLDDYGRMSTVLTPNISNPNGPQPDQSNTNYISPDNSTTINDLRVYIYHKPPAFASKYRIYLKQSTTDNYSTIFPTIFYRDGSDYYFMIDRSEVNKVDVGSFIYMKQVNGIATNSNKQYKVIEVEVKPDDFLGNGEFGGLYFMISDTGGDIITDVFDAKYVGLGLAGGKLNGKHSLDRQYIVDQGTFFRAGSSFNGQMNAIGQIDIPVFYGASTTHNRIQLLAPSPSGKITPFDTFAKRDARIKITITDNETFKVENFSNGIYELWYENVDLSLYYASSTSYLINNPPSAPGVPTPTPAYDLGIYLRFNKQSGYNVRDYFIINVHSRFGLSNFGVTTAPTGSYNNTSTGQFGSIYSQGDLAAGDAISIITGGGGHEGYEQNVLSNTPTQIPLLPSGSRDYPALDKRIATGALIEMNITENLYVGGALTSTKTSQNRFFANNKYLNIEEWFYEEDIWQSFRHVNCQDTSDNNRGTRIFFRRVSQNHGSLGIPSNYRVDATAGTNDNNDVFLQALSSGPNGAPNLNSSGNWLSWAKLIAFDYPVAAFIRSSQVKGQTASGSNSAVGDGSYKVMELSCEFNIVQNEKGSPIFETKPTEVDTGIFYEMPYTFNIDKGNNAHIANQQSQYNGNPAIVSLNQNSYNVGDFTTTEAQNSAFNCFSFGNGVEATRIKGQFNSAFLRYSPRVSTDIEDYSEEHLPASLTYSGVFTEYTNVNNLNEFNLSLANFKDVNKEYGPIQKLYSRDTDLVLFQEDKVSRVLFGKNLLSDSVGGGSVASIPQVLGTQITYTGEYGISENPESFASWGNNMYFTDAKRGAVLQLGLNGIFEISNLGMNDYFKDLFRDNLTTQKIGAMDPFKEQYVLSSNNTPAPPCNFSFSANFVPQIGKNGSTETLEITSSKAWTITAIDTGSGVNWITFNGSSPSYGNSRSEIVTMVFQANTTTSNRFFQLQISGCGSSTTNIDFTQSGQGDLTTGVIGVGNTNKGGRVAISSNENRQTGSLTYDFTSNTSGAFASIDQQMLDDSEAFISGSTTGIEGFGRNPSTGDNVTLTASRLGAVDRDAFDPSLGTKMYYLLTNTEYLQSQTEEIIANPSTVELTPLLTGDNWTGTITNFSRAGFDHFYTLIDYRGKITAGATSEFAIPIQTNTSAGNSTTRLDFGDKEGRISLAYTPVSGTGATGNIFNIRLNGTIVASSGTTPTTSSGTLDFLKTTETAIYDAEIIHYGEGDNITGEGINKIAKMDITNPTLTEFTYENSASSLVTTDANYVCRSGALPSTTKYHNGSNPLPEAGDILYENPNGTARIGDDAYHRYGSNTSPSTPAAPLNYYLSVLGDGTVDSTNLCAACAETVVPVITLPSTININQGTFNSINIQTTNDPIFYNVVGTCNELQVTAGADGATISWSDCQSIARSASIQPNDTIVIEVTGTTYSTTSGTTTFINSGTSSTQYLPSGLFFNQEEGVISGTPTETGTFTLVFNAQNCFGTSSNSTITISVTEEGQRTFEMDGSQFGTTSALTCNIAAGQLNSTLFYHSGSTVYPQVNDIVTVPILGQGGTSNTNVFRGGYVWYKAPWDIVGTGNGTALLIDDRGVIVEIYTCPS